MLNAIGGRDAMLEQSADTFTCTSTKVKWYWDRVVSSERGRGGKECVVWPHQPMATHMMPMHHRPTERGACACALCLCLYLCLYLRLRLCLRLTCAMMGSMYVGGPVMREVPVSTTPRQSEQAEGWTTPLTSTDAMVISQ